MPRITVELLRKRAEHNEGITSTLEEISLHQEELEKIEVIGTLCRKLQILYLQNNIIEKIEDLTHMKELQYLNLALNNISRIEGLQSCEFLNKLDLTVNFIDFDTLEESLDHLKPLQHLRELYMLGNPCQSNWETGFREYVIACLPQLQILDGKDIHRSDHIKALQVLRERQKYVRREAKKILAKKALEQKQGDAAGEESVIEVVGGEATDISLDGEGEPTAKKKRSLMASTEKVPYTPHTRREMYLEMAEQKEEEDARRRENQPRERNLEIEHEQALQQARSKEERADGSIRQCNEGKWEFRMTDDILDVSLEVDLPRFLDTSLVDVDVHPSYVSIVAKNKVLRLRFPELVHSDAGKAERSKINGTLRLTLPKAHITPTQQLRAQLYREEQEQKSKLPKDKKLNNERSTITPTQRRSKLSDELLEAANSAPPSQRRGGAVSIRGLVKKDENGNNNALRGRLQMKPLVTKTSARHVDGPEGEEDDEDAPPLIS